MPTPTEGFVNSLHAFDPLLSVRYGEHIGRWVVERKAYIAETEIWYLTRRTERMRVRCVENPTNVKFRTEYDEIREELIAIRSNKRTVLMPKELNSQVFNMLAMMDTRRWGGYSRMADELENQDALKEEDRERQLTNENQARHKHTFDILSFLWRKRLTQLANGDHLRKSLKELVGTSEL